MKIFKNKLENQTRYNYRNENVVVVLYYTRVDEQMIKVNWLLFFRDGDTQGGGQSIDKRGRERQKERTN